jgi:ATP-binding cassette, subfamily B, bacterial
MTLMSDGAPSGEGAPSLSRASRARVRLAGLIRDLAGQIDTSGGGVPAAPVVPLRTVFRRFWPYARRHRGLIATAGLFAVLSPLVTTVTIGFFSVLVDEVLVPRDLQAFWGVALAYLALAAASALTEFGRSVVGALAGERFVLSMRTDVFAKLQELSLAFFERRRLGDVIARLTGDIGAIERLVVSGVFRAISYVLRILFFTVALFYFQWLLALASLVVVPIFWSLARSFSRRIKDASREQRRRSGSVSAVIEESLANIALVQAYNRQQAEADHLEQQNLARFRARMAATRLQATFAPITSGLELLGTLIVAGLGTYLLARGALTIGELLAFGAYLSQLYSPVRRLGGLVNTAYAAAASAERVLELMNERPAIHDDPTARSVGTICGRLEFDDVTFYYPGAERPALEGVSFSAEPGQVIALVGASGAGKSTLVKLILRFYDPQRGAVRLDGKDLRALRLNSVREQIAVLLQETLVFDGTIRENIAFGRPGASEEDLLRAARAADLHDFVSTLPDGYESAVGQRGRLLSGGQRQRLAIARAMVRDAPLLVLDEPTVGLDGEAIHRVLDPLRRLMAERTTIVISHDLLTTREADVIVVLEHGRVVECGNHEKLIAANGTYAQLWAARGAPVVEVSSR